MLRSYEERQLWYDMKDVALLVWKFPLKAFMLFFLSLNVTLFILHRMIMFVDFYNIELLSATEHTHVLEHICQNATLKAGLGENYMEMCHTAEELSRRYVLLSSLKRTIQDTHLCGDVACIEYFERILEIVTRSLAFTMCAVLIGVLGTLVGVIYCCGGRNARTRTSYQNNLPIQIQELDLKTQENYFTRKIQNVEAYQNGTMAKAKNESDLPLTILNFEHYDYERKQK